MNWWTRAAAAGALLVLFLALGPGVPALRGQLVPGVMKGIRIPEYDEQGRLKSRVTGDVAEPQPDGTVKVTNLRVEVYKEGKLEAVVWAASCLFDPKNKGVVSDSDVRVERRGAVIRGRGLRWDNERQQAQILEQVRVELRHANLWTQTEGKR